MWLDINLFMGLSISLTMNWQGGLLEFNPYDCEYASQL